MNGCSALAVERQVVGLHRRRSLEAVLVDRVEELLDAAGAETLFPVLPEGRLVVVGDDGVVGVEGEAGVRDCGACGSWSNGTVPIQSRRPEAPSTGASPSPDLRSGSEAGAEEADVAVDVGVDDVLRRRLLEPQRVEELVPVLRRVDAHAALRRSCRGRPGR